MIDFDEYDFLDYCKEQYLAELSEEDALREIKKGTAYDSARGPSERAWRLTCWLGEYLAKKIDKATEENRDD